MNKVKTVVVVGLGEVGKPLFDLTSKHHKAVGVDVAPPAADLKDIDVLHICYPFQIKDFLCETARYIELFKPKLTIINSTVAVGTTRAVVQRTGATVAYSPVRGKHSRMLEDLQRYAKFVGALDRSSAEQAAAHFESMHLKTKILSSPEAAEIAKLSETTFFGLMIAWAQEVERYAVQIGGNYDEIVSFYEEIPFFPPVKYFPGEIGGHCVMPNIELLKRFTDSEILRAIRSSNEKKIAQKVLQVKK
jgi:UDP-N-acetyl-D-mannosaminuronate dehydrogenase